MSSKRIIVRLLPLVLLVPAVHHVHAGDGLGSITEINAFATDFTPRKTTLSLTGQVQSVVFTPKHAQIILCDGNGERAELYRFRDVEQPAPGDIIHASGQAYFGQNLEFFFTVEKFEVLEHGPRPEPLSVRLADLNPETHHLAIIRTEGTVVDAMQDEMDRRFMILLIKDEGCIIPASFLMDTFGDRSDLVDARIRITGIFRQSVSGIRKVAWPNIQPIAPGDLEILAPPPTDPFSVPTLERKLYLSTDEVMKMSKRSVTGEVLATWGDNNAMVRTRDGRIVNIVLMKNEKLPTCGETIIATGQPETDLFRINLSAVRWKTVPANTPTVVDETPTDAADAFWDNNGRRSIKGEIHGSLISAEGIVRILPSPGDTDRRFVIDTGDLQIPVDATANPELLNGLEIGSRIRVTGRCLLQTDLWRRDNVVPKTKGFMLVVRSAADIVILSRPPWWTTGRLLLLVAILLLALAGVGAWHLIQRHFARLKIVERTRLAVELHDSLSQNLAGVACQVAAGCNAVEDDPKTAITRIKAAERMLQSCRTELRHCLFDLRSDMLEETNFKSAILKALNQLADEAVITIRFTARRSDFPDPAAHAILSVIRELSANAIRHGHAASVRIAGCVDRGQLLFSVTDDGSGFDPQHCVGIADGHFGLSGVRDRLKRLNGTIVFTSSPGKGAKATVTLPIPKK